MILTTVVICTDGSTDRRARSVGGIGYESIVAYSIRAAEAESRMSSHLQHRDIVARQTDL